MLLMCVGMAVFVVWSQAQLIMKTTTQLLPKGDLQPEKVKPGFKAEEQKNNSRYNEILVHVLVTLLNMQFVSIDL